MPIVIEMRFFTELGWGWGLGWGLRGAVRCVALRKRETPQGWRPAQLLTAAGRPPCQMVDPN
eukprot:scaffold64240_cov27-Phaeocystis_antarctica.AAC.1